MSEDMTLEDQENQDIEKTESTQQSANSMTTYEQQVEQRSNLIAQRNEYFEKQLRENLPTAFLIIYSFALVLLGIASIVFQIICIINDAEMSSLYSGFWAGCYYFIMMGIVILLSNLILNIFKIR
jgi:hypothetical protein